MQRKITNLIKYVDSLNEFESRLQNFIKQIIRNNFVMFVELSSIFGHQK